jgi:hypothetical protein
MLREGPGFDCRSTSICRFAVQMNRCSHFPINGFDLLCAANRRFLPVGSRSRPSFRGLSCSATRPSAVITAPNDLAAHVNVALPPDPQAPPARAAPLIGAPRRARGPPVDRRDPKTCAPALTGTFTQETIQPSGELAARQCSAYRQHILGISRSTANGDHNRTGTPDHLHRNTQ